MKVEGKGADDDVRLVNSKEGKMGNKIRIRVAAELENSIRNRHGRNK